MHRTVTQQEAEGEGGGSEPDRILHEGRGQGEPASPGFSSLHFTHIILHCKAREPKQGAALGCPVMKVRRRFSTEVGAETGFAIKSDDSSPLANVS